MNVKFNKNAKVEQLTKVVLSHGEEKDLIVKDPYQLYNLMVILCEVACLLNYYRSFTSVEVDS